MVQITFKVLLSALRDWESWLFWIVMHRMSFFCHLSIVRVCLTVFDSTRGLWLSFLPSRHLTKLHNTMCITMKSAIKSLRLSEQSSLQTAIIITCHVIWLVSVSPHRSFASSSPHARVSDPSRAPSPYMCSADAQQISVVLGIAEQYGLVEWHGYYDTLRQPKATLAAFICGFAEFWWVCVCANISIVFARKQNIERIFCAPLLCWHSPCHSDFDGVFRFCNSNHRIDTINVPTVQRSNCDEMTPSAMIRNFALNVIVVGNCVEITVTALTHTHTKRQ